MSDPAARKAETEAAAWFARLSRLSVTTEALRDFRTWKQDARNADAYARVEASWRAAGDLSADPEIQAAAQAALERHPPMPVRRRPGAALGSALVLAGLTLAIGLGAALLMLMPQRYDTRVGEQRLVVLDDGSRVRLNTDSEVRVRYTRGLRRVELARGEAFFEVAHDAARPFVVRADSAEVRALGTKFDVRREAGDVRVTLLEGRVRIDHGDHPPAMLAPNQQATVTARGVSVPRTADADEAAGWTSGRLIFHSLALRDAIAEVNRYTPRKIVLEAPPAVAAQPVTGTFDVGDTAAFVAGIGSLLDLQATATPDGGVRLAPRPAAPDA